MSARKVIGLKGGWLSKVTPGTPFSLVHGEVISEVESTKRVKKALVVTTLKGMGELMTIKQVAELCKVHPATVYRWIYDGALKPVRAGRAIRIPVPALEEFLCA